MNVITSIENSLKDYLINNFHIPNNLSESKSKFKPRFQQTTFWRYKY